jgi:hypothetical protein
MKRTAKPNTAKTRRLRRRSRGDLSGRALVAAMRASPHREIDLEPRRFRLPVREVRL